MTTIPPAPTEPTPRTLPSSYIDTQDFDSYAAARDARDDAFQARIAELEAGPTPTPVPAAGTVFGVNASAKAEHDARVTRYGPVVGAWRYYHQPGEALTYPSEYALKPGETFVGSGKVLPQNLTLTEARKAGHPVLLPQQMTTSMFLSLFRSAPTDRILRWDPWHEPEDDIRDGHFTVAQYKASFTRAKAAAKQVGPHIKIVPILMGYSWSKASGRNVEDYIPADEDFDELLADVYYAGNIGGSVSGIPTGFDAVIATAKKHGKPWGIGEAGVGNKVSGKTRLDALTLYAKTAREKGASVVCYFDNAEWANDATAAAAWKAGQQ